MLGSGGTLLGLRTQRTDPPDVLVNMMEVGEETRQECNSMKENLMCPVVQSMRATPLPKSFQGGYITNDWEVLVKRTAVFFKWMAAIARKKTDNNSMSASNIAVLFWVKQEISKTWKAFREKKLQELRMWEHEGMLLVSGRARD